MNILIDYIIVIFLFLFASMSLSYILFHVVRCSLYQVKMLKHRPRLWWQFHKKYYSCEDPKLEIDSNAIEDMSDEEYARYLIKLALLRRKVHDMDCFDSGVRVTKDGFVARRQYLVTPTKPRYDDVYKSGVDWLDGQ